MITFETQQDFENAVLTIITNSLRVDCRTESLNLTGNSYDRLSLLENVYLRLRDNSEPFTSAR